MLYAESPGARLVIRVKNFLYDLRVSQSASVPDGQTGTRATTRTI